MAQGGPARLKLLRRGAWAAVAVALALIAGTLVYRQMLPGAPEIGGAFSLIDQTGKRVTNADFNGKIQVIYFGFTHCPDVCPTSLQVISGALKKLGPEASKVQPIFITLDPERDTSEVMAEYVAYFVPGMVGLTGTQEEIDNTARLFRVAHWKVEDPNSSMPYTIDHASLIFVMDRQGKFLRFFQPGVTADELAETLRGLI